MRAHPMSGSRFVAALVATAAVAVACGSEPRSVGPGSGGASRSPSAVGPSPGDTPSTSGSSPSTGLESAPPLISFDPTAVAVALEPVIGGFEAPLAIANAGDGSGRLFVALQGGEIRIVRDGQIVDQPFLDIGDRITSGGERGLLGVAFHPRFPDDPRVFVDYTDDKGDTRISSFTIDPANPDRADPASERRLLFVKQPYANHNGGALVFGPDGFLHVALGDGGSGGDPQGNGQSLRTLLGKILRIDIDQSSADRAYGIPADNPYANGADGRQPEIWLTGLRNPWRMSFDRTTGDLWIGDVGQNAWEEVDVQRAAAKGGTNFGWNLMEGNHCFRPATGCEDSSLAIPVTDYSSDQGCTVIGGNVYRGTAQAALRGGYLFADYCSGRMWVIDPATDEYRSPTLVGDSGRNLSAFGEDEAGELFATDISAGALLRVTATTR